MMISCVKDVLQDAFWIMPQTPEYIEEGVPYITSKNIKNGKIDFSKVNYISRESFEQISKNRPVLHGDILISMIGTLGETAEVTKADGVFYGQNMFLVRLDESKVDKRYFLNYFKSNFVVRALAEKQNQSTQKYLKANHIEDLQIPILPLFQQKQIAATLDKISSLIFYRQQQLQQLDELVKARFVEMFGDYDLSHTQSDWKPISEIGKVVGGATPKTTVDEYWDGEYRWITPAELQSDSGYIYDSVRKLTKSGVESCSLQEMPIGTVILSSRAPIGKVAIAGNTFYCNQGFKNIICSERVIPRYLYTILLLNTEYLNSLGRGATFKEISKTIVENIRIPVPSLELQNQFASFVEQVDKSKVVVQKTLDEAQTLFDSLMQEYFG